MRTQSTKRAARLIRAATSKRLHAKAMESTWKSTIAEMCREMRTLHARRFGFTIVKDAVHYRTPVKRLQVTRVVLRRAGPGLKCRRPTTTAPR